MDIRHQNGAVAELYVATRLADKGYGIFFPFMTQSRCDLVVEIDRKLYKVQIKKASWSKSGDNRYLQARLSGKNKETHTPYRKEDVDLFAFTDLDRVWLAPFDEIGHQTSVCLDSTNPKYRPQTKYNAKDWLL